MEDETILSAGNVNARVVRIGNTVRRTMTNASPAVHQLLLHLERKGFPGSPSFLGVDEQNREILSFLEGQTGIPEHIWQRDEPLVAAARLLRAYHDATVDFPQSDDQSWAYRYPDHSRREVICHNDFAPYNFVYTEGIPHAVFDFDLAGPGPRLRDVAYAVYWLVPLSFNSADQIGFAEADVQNGSRRCRLFCETYGLSFRQELFEMLVEVLTFMSSEDEMRQALGDVAAGRLKQDGHLAHWRRELQAFQRNRARVEKNLSC